MGRLRENIPNAITLCNLLSGTLGIIEIMHGSLLYAAAFIFLGALFDLLDGASARLLNAHSELGKELDSLADMISFGLCPSLLIYSYLGATCHTFGSSFIHIIPYFSIFIAVFTALRLARFNIDSNDSTFFRGLPCPANALIIASFPFIAYFYPISSRYFLISIPALLGFIFISCFLLISNFKLMSFKFQNFKWHLNEYRIVFLAASVTCIFLLKFAAVPFIVILYFLLSFIQQQQKIK